MNPLEQWHRWWAWYPVRVSGRWVWGRALERRLVVLGPMQFSNPTYWDYRAGVPAPAGRVRQLVKAVAIVPLVCAGLVLALVADLRRRRGS